MEVITKQVEVKFDAEDLECIIDMIGYGVNYWASRIEILPNDVFDITYLDPETDENTKRLFTKEDLEAAYGRVMAGDYPVVDYIRAYFSGDAGDFDSEAGDVLMQAVLFPERLVYG